MPPHYADDFVAMIYSFEPLEQLKVEAEAGLLLRSRETPRREPLFASPLHRGEALCSRYHNADF